MCSFETCRKALDDYLNKVVFQPKPVVPPSLVHYEVCRGSDEIKLSFAIKVF